LGWGIIGCGDITEKRAAPAILAESGSELIAFQSRTPGRAAAFAERFGATRGYHQRSDLLADTAVDLVYVATEHHRHCEDTVAAAEAGKHVLVEKPMALDLESCRRMQAACRANGVWLAVAYYRRFYPKAAQMKKWLDAGAIGEPVTASIHLSSRLNPGRRRPDNWRLDASRSGGGSLADAGIHRIDLICHLLGRADRVAAFVECQEMPIEAPDAETLLIRMRNGCHVVSRHGFRTRSEDEFTIVGTEGTLIATPMDGPGLRLIRDGEAETLSLPRAENVHAPLIADFAAGVRSGRGPTYDGEAGALANEILEAAYESARTGRVIAVTEALIGDAES